MPFTVVSFHAHPDDEALLVAGTLARAAAEGHTVVIVTATAGAAGLTDSTTTTAGDLGAIRLDELRRSAHALGCHDVRCLGYADSGYDPPGHPKGGAGLEEPAVSTGRPEAVTRFAAADIDAAATRLAQILTETGADVLTIYDPAGGYGHLDHVQVHRVGRRAAEMSRTPVVLEATVDRRPLVRALRAASVTGVLRLLRVDRTEWNAHRFAHAFADPDRITHKVDVRTYRDAKRAAMAAHASQAGADQGVRTLAAILKLPAPLFERIFGHEWFVEHGRTAGPRLLDDIFASLRTPVRDGGTRPAGPA